MPVTTCMYYNGDQIMITQIHYPFVSVAKSDLLNQIIF